MHLGGTSLQLVGLHAEPNNEPAPGATSSKADAHFEATLREQIGRTDGSARVQVAARRTQLSTAQAKDALKQAWQQHHGSDPSEETVAVLTAQWSHETGNGRSMFNYNFGGIKGTGPSGLTVVQRTKEGWGATERTISDNFRAYQSASEGAADYLSLLKRKYPEAIEAAKSGDPARFVRELKRGGYFTGNEGAYIRSVSQRTAQLLGGTPRSNGAAPSIAERTQTAPAQPTPHVVPPGLNEAHLSSAYLAGSSSQGGALAPTDQRAVRSEPPLSSLDLRAFDDALSRAALRIALGTENKDFFG